MVIVGRGAIQAHLQLNKKKKNHVYKNRGWEPIHKKNTRQMKAQLDITQRKKQTINKNKIKKTLCEWEPCYEMTINDHKEVLKKTYLR